MKRIRQNRDPLNKFVGRGRAEVGSVKRSLFCRCKNRKNGHSGKNGLMVISCSDPTSRSLGMSNKQDYTGHLGNTGHKGISLHISFFLFSIFHLFFPYKNISNINYHLERKLDVALLSSIISPTLEYSPESIEESPGNLYQNYDPRRNSSDQGTRDVRNPQYNKKRMGTATSY